MEKEVSEWIESFMLLGSVVVRTTIENAPKSEATWMQSYGQLIGVAIGAVSTGAVALLLAVMNNRGTDRRLRQTQAYDLLRESQRITRERLEELYVQVGHWTLGIAQINMFSLRLAQGKLNYVHYSEMLKAHAEKSHFQKSRMDLLNDVYGSVEIHEASKSVKEAQSKFMKKFTVIEEVAMASARFGETLPTKPPADPAMYQLMDRLANEVDKRGRELLELIATMAKS